jgi:hypothetical protein
MGLTTRPKLPLMTSPIFDFSHLNPEERIQLAGSLRAGPRL